jgi:phosphoribosylformylglycinamidine (FGAM) synthase-like enzyme
LAITDCLNFGNVNDPHVMAELVGSIEGITNACLELGIPVVSGNVSLYNATDGRSISPTPMIGVVGKVKDVRSTRPAIMVDQTSDVWLLSPQHAVGHFCATTAEEVLAFYDSETSQPSVNWKEELNANEILESLASDNDLLAVRPVGRAGVFGATVKFIVEGITRSDASLEGVLAKFLTEPARLVSERGSSYVVQISKQASFERCVRVAASRGFSFEKVVELGKVGVSGGLHVANTYIGWHEILEALKVDKNLAELVPE